MQMEHVIVFAKYLDFSLVKLLVKSVSFLEAYNGSNGKFTLSTCVLLVAMLSCQEKELLTRTTKKLPLI